jgi:hypothetical protein
MKLLRGDDTSQYFALPHSADAYDECITPRLHAQHIAEVSISFIPSPPTLIALT